MVRYVYAIALIMSSVCFDGIGSSEVKCFIGIIIIISFQPINVTFYDLLH